MKTILHKATILTLLMLCVTGYTFGAGTSITVNSVTPNVSCYGPAATTSIIFTKGGSYTSGNQFIAQLSDASGGWGNPVNIGSITSTVSNGFAISATIPLNTPAGSGYKIRVVSTTPVVISGNSLSFIINPLPAANAGSSSAICLGNSAIIGAAAVPGNTYSWISSPSGFTSTSANPTVSPTVTTIYTLTETIEATGCTKSNSVTITVNPLPAANAGSPSAICLGNNATIGVASVAGNTYSWVSSPAGFTSTSANPTVSPTVTTSYTLTETITATGCTKSNSVTITVNPLPIVSLGTFPTAYLPSSIYPLTGGSPSGGTYSGTGVSGTNFNPTQVGAGNYVITYTYTDGNGCTNSDTSSIFVRVPDTKVRTADCGITLSTLDQLIYCDKVIGATGYEWKLETTGFSKTFNQTSSNIYFRPSYLSGISYGTSYTVYVRAKIGSSSGTFNASCIISTPLSIPKTKLRSADCGITLSSLDQLIFCNPVSGASAYEWKLEATGFSKTFYQSSSNTYFRPSYLTGISYATTYTVSVRAKAGTTWGVFDSTCVISTPAEVQYTKVRDSDCGITLSNLDQLIYCDPVSGAQAYEWQFDASGYSKTYYQSSSNTYFRPSWLTDLSLGTTYTVGVRARAGTSWGKFNVTCEITTPSGKQMQSSNENNFMEVTKEGNNEMEITEKKSETIITDKDFNVYPNPNSGIINIATAYTVGVIEIYNQLGQVVHSEKIVSNKTTIDLSKLKNGEYILKAKNTQGAPRLCELSLCDTDSGIQVKTIVIKK